MPQFGSYARIEPGVASTAHPTSVEVRCIAHCDADRFFFAVEALENPDLAADPRPIVVGHDPRTSPRSIVTTANDAARALGIGSGMSAAIAQRLAPNALFVPPRHALYRGYSERLMRMLREASPVVQSLSIDEAWLDWSAHGFDAGSAERLRATVLAETGLSISIGVATSKLVAKMATEVAKPGGVCVVPPGDRGCVPGAVADSGASWSWATHGRATERGGHHHHWRRRGPALDCR